MKRKDYEKPTMQVVKIQNAMLLLQTSGTRKSYGSANEGIDTQDLDEDGNWEWD